MRLSGRSYRGRTLVPGKAEGRGLVLGEPLSFWGGMDPEKGEVVDRRHPQAGVRLTDSVLVMPSGRGSSSSSSVLAEAIRAGTAPRAILLREPDGIVALGALVAAELYDIRVPVVVLGDDYGAISSGDAVRVEAGEDSATVLVGS